MLHDPDRDHSRLRLHVTRSESPFRGLVRGPDDEGRLAWVAAVRLPPDLERAAPVAPGLARLPHLVAACPTLGPLLAVDGPGRRVVVDDRAFTDLARVDATALPPGETRALGAVRDPRLLEDPEQLVVFLVASELVKTYAHLEATLEVTSLARGARGWRAELEGEHVYFTRRRNTGRLRFALELDDDGALRAVGL